MRKLAVLTIAAPRVRLVECAGFSRVAVARSRVQRVLLIRAHGPSAALPEGMVLRQPSACSGVFVCFGAEERSVHPTLQPLAAVTLGITSTQGRANARKADDQRPHLQLATAAVILW